jgi:CD109 antigen
MEAFYSIGSTLPLRVRNDFPETWIWEDFMECESVQWSKKVPDTITSWVISAFSMNRANGLGLNDSPTTLTVFRPFFVSTTLPYSVKRGEQLILSIQVFNYLPSDQDVTVTLSNEDQQFDFVDDPDAIYGRCIYGTEVDLNSSNLSFQRTAKHAR